MLKAILSVVTTAVMLLSGIFCGGEKQQSGKLQSSFEQPGIYEFHFYHPDPDRNFFFKW